MKSTPLSRRQSNPEALPVDTSRCPLCGNSNRCVMTKAGANQDQCWCVNAQFSPALLDQVPGWARDKVCICAQCAAAQSAGEAGT